MHAIFWLVEELVQLYIYAVFVWTIMSMLISFGVVDGGNQIVYQIFDFLTRLTAPGLNPIRRILPNFGAVDISPVVLIVLLEAVEMLLNELENFLFAMGWAF